MVDRDRRGQPNNVDSQISKIARREWKKFGGEGLSRIGEIDYAADIINRAINVVRAKPLTRNIIDDYFTRDSHVQVEFLRGRVEFAYAVNVDGEYLSLAVDNEEADIELIHGKKGLKKAVITFFEDTSKEDTAHLEGFSAAQRSSGLVDKMAALLINDVPRRHHPRTNPS